MHDVIVKFFYPPSGDENNVGKLCDWVYVCACVYFQK